MNRIAIAQRALQSLRYELGENPLRHAVSKTTADCLLIGLKTLEWQLTVEGQINARSGSDSDVGTDSPDSVSDLHG